MIRCCSRFWVASRDRSRIAGGRTLPAGMNGRRTCIRLRRRLLATRAYLEIFQTQRLALCAEELVDRRDVNGMEYSSAHSERGTTVTHVHSSAKPVTSTGSVQRGTPSRSTPLTTPVPPAAVAAHQQTLTGVTSGLGSSTLSHPGTQPTAAVTVQGVSPGSHLGATQRVAAAVQVGSPVVHVGSVGSTSTGKSPITGEKLVAASLDALSDLGRDVAPHATPTVPAGGDLDAPCVVIKIGTSTIMRYDSEGEAGELALSTLGKLVDSIVALRRLNHNVVLVTSGAVGVGCRELGLRKRPDSLRTKQAMAAIGQCKLMRVYDDLFRFSGQTIAQILLTRENLSQKHQYFNARNTMRELLRLGVVPIVNENDTVATEELRFGDNDRLSSLVAGMVEAKWLFLLTDVDKLYTADPRQHPGAEPIDIVHDMEQLHVRLSANEDAVSSEQEQRAESDTHAAHGPKSQLQGGHVPRGGTQWGSGGMATKIVAAQLATAAGVHVCIMHGRRPEGILERVLDKKGSSRIGTVFLASREPIRGGRKRWIAHGLAPKGKLYVDDGACRAVARHNSLFAAGIREVDGDFEADTAVSIVRQSDGLEVGRGLTNYSSDEIRRIIGLHSKEIRRVLGYPGPDEVIHRDNLVDLLGTISSSDADETD